MVWPNSGMRLGEATAHFKNHLAKFPIRNPFKSSKMTVKELLTTVSLCAGLLAGCVSQGPVATMDKTAMPRLTGKAATVTRLTTVLAGIGLTIRHPMNVQRRFPCFAAARWKRWCYQVT